MEHLLNRYRNITALLLAIFAQLILLGYQVRSDQDVRIIRVWAVTAVTPLARGIETLRSSTVGVIENYFVLRDLREDNRRMQAELARLKMENRFLKSELSTAERAKALSVFQARTLSRTLAARVFGTGAGANSRVLFVDRGSLAGVQKGMAVVNPDGIVGKILAAFPTASQVMLITDPDFAAGVVSQKHQVKGALKGLGYANCRVDYIPNEEKVEAGEIFYTSGDDRIFPKGFPAAFVRVVRPGTAFKEILVEPLGMKHGLEEVLILLESVHQAIPENQVASSSLYLAPRPPGASPDDPSSLPKAAVGTDADRLRERYRTVGDAQGHKFGEGLPGSKPPDFNLQPGAARVQATSPSLAPQSPGDPKPTSDAPPAQPGSTPQSGQPAPSTAPKPAASNPPAAKPEAPSTPAPAAPSAPAPKPGSAPPSAPAPAAAKPDPSRPAAANPPGPDSAKPKPQAEP